MEFKELCGFDVLTREEMKKVEGGQDLVEYGIALVVFLGASTALPSLADKGKAGQVDLPHVNDGVVDLPWASQPE